MNNIESSIPKLINLLKIVEPTLKKESKVVMLMDTSRSKNKKKKKSMKPVGGAAGRRPKRKHQRDLLPLWPRWSLEEELQSPFRVLEEEAIKCPIYFKYVCH